MWQRNSGNPGDLLQQRNNTAGENGIDAPDPLFPPPPPPPSTAATEADLERAIGVGDSTAHLALANPPPPPVHVVCAHRCPRNRAAIGANQPACDRVLPAPPQPPPQ